MPLRSLAAWMLLLTSWALVFVLAVPGREPVLSRSNPWQFRARMGWWPLSSRVERRVYFYPDGRVEFDDGEAGQWDCANDCVSWTTVPVGGGEKHHYHANLHHNQFGLRPRMFCGVITRDRASAASLFRPVLGSFVSHGTPRTSYVYD